MDHNSTESCSLNLKVDSSISVSITQCYQTIWLLNKKKLFLEKSSHFDTSICEFSIEQKVIHYCSLKKKWPGPNSNSCTDILIHCQPRNKSQESMVGSLLQWLLCY